MQKDAQKETCEEAQITLQSEQEPTYLIYKEVGQSLSWFTEMLFFKESNLVYILAHYRLHWSEYDKWPERCQKAPLHANYERETIQEDKYRFLTHYYVPLVDNWVPIINSMHRFGYPFHDKVDPIHYVEKSKVEEKKTLKTRVDGDSVRLDALIDACKYSSLSIIDEMIEKAEKEAQLWNSVVSTAKEHRQHLIDSSILLHTPDKKGDM